MPKGKNLPEQVVIYIKSNYTSKTATEIRRNVKRIFDVDTTNDAIYKICSRERLVKQSMDDYYFFTKKQVKWIVKYYPSKRFKCVDDMVTAFNKKFKVNVSRVQVSGCAYRNGVKRMKGLKR